MIEQLAMGMLIGLVISAVLYASIQGLFSLVWYCQNHDNLVTESIRFVGALIVITLFMVFFYVIR